MYTGQIATILAGQGGFNGSDNFDAIPITDLLTCRQVRFDGNSWRKVGGLAELDANAVSSAPNCLGGTDFWIDASTQHQITAWDSGKLYKEVSGDLDAVTLETVTLSNSSPTVMLTCGQESAGSNRKLLIFSQGVVTKVVNGTANTTANIAYPSVDWSSTNQPMGGVMHDRRVYAWGNQNARHTIYASAIDNHENFLRYTPANSTSEILPSFDINPGEGEEIRSCYSIGSTRLYVFKYPVGIYWVDTRYITSYYTPVTTVRNDLGIAGPLAITKVGSLGTFFIGNDGHIYNLELINNPDVDPRDASLTATKRLNQWIKDNVDLTRLKFAQLKWDNNRKELWAMYTDNSGTVNNIGLVFDLNDPSNPRIAVEDRGTYFNALWIRRNTRGYNDLIVAGSGGKAYVANDSERVIGASTGYEAELRTTDTDFSWLDNKLAAVTKRLDWIEFVYNNTLNATLYIDTYIDGSYYNTYTATMGSTQYTLGIGSPNPFILGTSTLFKQGLGKRKIKIGGIGKRFGFRLRNSVADSDFSISKALVHFQPLDTQGEQ